MKLTRKVTVLALALCMIFTMMPFGIMTADADSEVKGNFSYGHTLKDADGNVYDYPESEMKHMQIYLANYVSRTVNANGSAKELKTLKAYRVNGKVAYCFEHGVLNNTVSNLQAKQAEQAIIHEAYTKVGAKKEDKSYAFINMGLCLYYGRQEGSSIYDLLNSPEEGGLGFREWRKTQSNLKGTNYTLDDWEAATRQLVHESQQLFRNEDFTLVGTSLKYEDNWHGNRLGTIETGHYQSAILNQPAYDIYRYMVRLIKDHKKFSTNIASTDSEDPTEIMMNDNGDGTWTSNKIYVSKERAFDLRVVKTSGESFKDIKIELFDKTTKPYYVVTYKGDLRTDKTFTVKKAVQGKNDDIGNMLVWECKDGKGGHIQALATGAADPVPAYLKFTKDTKEPDGEIPEPELFNIQIPISKIDSNDGFDGDNKTPMGDATLDATYVLLKDGVEIDRLTLNEVGETKYFTDMPIENVSDLKRDPTGSFTHMVGTKEHCTVAPTTITWTGTVNYEIKEVRPDGRYIEPDSGVRNLTYSYKAVTNDTRGCTSDPQNWTEIDYTINLKTDKDNIITGKYEEIAPLEPLSYNETFMTFVNDCYRGKITLSKSIQNEDVFSEDGGGLAGGQKDSIDSYWRLKLNSGGYENSPYVRYVKEADEVSGTAVYKVVRDNTGISCLDTPMKIGTNGDLLIYDVPYGEYTLEEVKADNISYVLESVKVVIDEHGFTYSPTQENDNRYDCNLRDKTITNIVKVQKTNAETGKTVTAPGTKFYIKYIGNQLLADPTTSKNYGRLLPNAESITKDGPYTFEADENGEITIPYEIPYGTYQLLEWNLPEGYFVGAYDKTGQGTSHDYGTVEEGQVTAAEGSKWDDLVSIYDKDGNKIEYKDKSEYELAEVFNTYEFVVDKQEPHVDGNLSQLVTADDKVSSADPSYDAKDYPYINHYKAVSMANNNVKGKLELYKKGEVLSGFKEVIENGKKVMKPVYKETGLAGAVFAIYAGEDILLNDGNDGPDIFLSSDDSKVEIPVTKSTHAGNLLETVTSALSKFFTGEGSVYETGEKEDESGAKLWFIKDRSVTEEGTKKTVYVSPEEKDTSYSYIYETTEDGINKQYKVNTTMSYQAGGKSITKTEITKVSTVANGFMVNIPLTSPKGSVGDTALDPLDSYIFMDSPDSTKDFTALTVSNETFKYESTGTKGKDIDGNETDFSAIGVTRYVEKDYTAYLLKASDLVTEERITVPGVDANGDSDFDDPEDTPPVKETKTIFEWENGKELLEKTVGAKAIMKDGIGYLVKTKGYYEKGEYTDEEGIKACDVAGNVLPEYEVPSGYTAVPYTGDVMEDTHYVLASKTEDGNTTYMTLLTGGVWQPCDANGNFQKQIVEKYSITYVQKESDDVGFEFSFDGLKVSSKADSEKKESVTEITKTVPVTPTITLGAGYTKTESADTVTFTGTYASAPMYFKFSDGIKMSMTYSGGKFRAVLEIPQSAVDRHYSEIVPTLFDTKDELSIDWYTKLTPENTVCESVPGDLYWKSERIESSKTGEVESYILTISSSAGIDKPIEIKFADGYTAKLYQDTSETGEGVALIEMEGLIKTERYATSDFVEFITTDEKGVATSSALPLGKYFITEYKAPAGYVTDKNKYDVELKYEDQFTPLVWDSASSLNKAMTVELDLSKVFETGKDTDNYAPASGATFGVYNAEDIAYEGGTLKKDTLMGSFSVDEKGKALYSSKLPMGTYYVKELTTRTGYILNETPFYFEVTDKAGEGLSKEFKADGVYASVTMDSYGKAIVKVRTEKRFPEADITVDGTKYNLGEKAESGNVKIELTDESSQTTVTLNDGMTTNITLPNGKLMSVTVNGNTYSYKIDDEEGTYIPSVIYTGYYAGYTAAEDAKEPKDHHITLTAAGETPDKLDVVTKHEAEGGKITTTVKALAGTVKEAVLSNGNTTEVLTGPDYIMEKGNSLSVTFDDGTHFAVLSKTNGDITVSCDNSLNLALTDENAPKLTVDEVVTPIEVQKSVTTARQDSSAEKLMIKINSLDNLTAGEIKNDADSVPYIPTTPSGGGSDEGIKTTAKDSETGTNISNADGKVTIIDTVSYYGLKINTKYIMRGVLMDKATGKEVLVGGKKVTAEMTFTPKTSSGTVDMAFTFDGSKLDGKDVVVFEKCFEVVTTVGTDGKTTETEKEEATHEDINDEGQTIHFPEIRTTAKDSETNTSISNADSKVTIIDTVKYTNLIVGKEYTIKGTLMNKETGKELLSGGKKVTAEKTFTPSSKDGEVELTFTFNASALAGTTVVVFEKCYQNGIEVASHEDITDKDQTIEIDNDERRINRRWDFYIPKTGDNSKNAGCFVFIMACSMILFFILKKKNIFR